MYGWLGTTCSLLSTPDLTRERKTKGDRSKQEYWPVPVWIYVAAFSATCQCKVSAGSADLGNTDSLCAENTHDLLHSSHNSWDKHTQYTNDTSQIILPRLYRSSPQSKKKNNILKKTLWSSLASFLTMACHKWPLMDLFKKKNFLTLHRFGTSHDHCRWIIKS